MGVDSPAPMDFNTFFAQSCQEMLARALVLARSRHDAEDAVQEAYIEALTRWDRISGYENPGAWVYRIVRQRLWKSSKRWARVRSLGSDEATRRAAHGDPELFTDAVQALSALAGLPDRQRMVMVMHCLHQMDQREIAEELGLTRGAVAATIFKARRKLEKALGIKDSEFTTELGSPVAQSRIGGPAITRKRDPVAAYLDGALSRVRRFTSVQNLDHILRGTHARTHESSESD